MAAPRIVHVVAVAENGVIGADGGMPWRLSSDLKEFRRLTMGKPIIMGRKTFAAIGRPLDGRDNIVITRDPDFAADGVTVAGSIEAALAEARRLAEARGVDEIAVIGGGEIYAATLAGADTLYVTKVHAAPDGDTRFPAIDPAVWREESRVKGTRGPRDNAEFSFIVYQRRDGKNTDGI
ncbi:MAG: dihydrofolate reductase [Hyphomicrobiales bacterium]